MKPLPLLLLIGAGFAVYYYAGLGAAASDLEIVFKNIEIQGITDYKITLTIQNVSNAEFVVNSLAGTVTLNGSSIGNISDFNAVTVPANTQQDIVIMMNLSVLSIPSVIQNFINQPSGNYVFEFNGHANVNNVAIPIDVSNTISI